MLNFYLLVSDCFVSFQELYKKYHLAMEHAEKVLTGSDQEDWVLEKAADVDVEDFFQGRTSTGVGRAP